MKLHKIHRIAGKLKAVLVHSQPSYQHPKKRKYALLHSDSIWDNPARLHVFCRRAEGNPVVLWDPEVIGCFVAPCRVLFPLGLSLKGSVQVRGAAFSPLLTPPDIIKPDRVQHHWETVLEGTWRNPFPVISGSPARCLSNLLLKTSTNGGYTTP